MADELVFYTHPMSRGRIVRWMLEELGVPYRTELLGFGPPMKTAEYLAINPMGKVPAITHRGVVVTEVAAILAYLADAFPEARLAPPLADPARGPYYRWLFFAAGPLEQAVVNRSFGFVLPDEGRGRAGYGSYEDVLRTLEAAVTAPDYIAGPAFTAADVYVGSHLGWGMMTGGIDKRPAFVSYARRVTSRPAAQRARAIDDALMEKKA